MKAFLACFSVMLLLGAVEAAAPRSCSILPSQFSIAVGESLPVLVSCFTQSGESVPCPSISWSASIGSLSSQAGASNVFLAGTKAGSGTISATGTYEELSPLPSAQSGGAQAASTSSAVGAIKREQFTCSASANVLPGKPASAKVFPSSITLPVGSSQKFSAELYDSYGNKIAQSHQLSWSSTAGIGSIDNTGLFVAKAPGSGKVTATYHIYAPQFYEPSSLPEYQESYNKISGSASVEVIGKAANAASCRIFPSEAAVKAGETQKFSIKCYSSPPEAEAAMPKEVPCPKMSWLSSSPSERIVPSDDDKGAAVLFAGEKVRELKITALSKDDREMPSVSCFASAKIVPGKLARISISPSKANLRVGDEQQFLASGSDQYGNAIPSPQVSWSSDSIGKIDNSGVFKAIAPGSGKVRASAQRSPFSEEAGVPSSEASVFVLEKDKASQPSSPSSGGGSGASATGGAMFSSVSTISYTCAGREASLEIKILKPKSSAVAELFLLSSGKASKIFSYTAKSDSKFPFTPPEPGEYELRVSVGTEQRTISFRVPECLPSGTDAPNSVTISLSPPKEPVDLPQSREASGKGKKEAEEAAPASAKQEAFFGIPNDLLLPIAAVSALLVAAVAGFVLFIKKPEG